MNKYLSRIFTYSSIYNLICLDLIIIYMYIKIILNILINTDYKNNLSMYLFSNYYSLSFK